MTVTGVNVQAVRSRCKAGWDGMQCPDMHATRWDSVYPVKVGFTLS